MSQMPERIDELEKENEVLSTALIEEGVKCDALQQRVTELEAQVADLERFRPVPVAEVPEEWKDTRWVFAWIHGNPYKASWDGSRECWMEHGYRFSPTHVSLPMPPKEAE